ncbi:N-6 DNA methylase [Cyclobacterium qasimii]|uniref:site-specific DNA-methyltransferase (adenine-specific) n=2 Tax=Cyclobacterium qasimii TaxID=1350429 RepID=S7WN91_9BACT|nr:N-6 DNA methylase [Cyclobacterium qasimii]EPR65653.1 Type I restriction-modification system, DNA-methyltransferase subunit M [Cyclobacterium qasimii M12-11B]GEO20171.1 hypothetical protein CQA01_07050 [Cyclobacterium qasimii]
MAKKQPKKNQKSMEETLWDSANKLRGTVESSEYKHVVLGLIFLKFTSDKFEERKEELISEGKEKYLEMREFYNMKNVFFLAPESRWSYVIGHSKQDDIALIVDTALHTIEKNNPSLKGALPDNYFSRLNLDPSKLAALLDTVNNIDTVGDAEEDVVGRIYEYFLGRFAAAEGKGGGEFYTPKSIVNLIAEMLEPYKGKIYDPACGSGGMFVQSVQFVKSHQGNTRDISIYGQEYTAVTYKLAKMNLAIRGITANLGDVPADTFFKDQHPDLKADYIMANPPFNQSQWREKSELEDDSRWAGFTTPPAGNANYAWILHMLSKLSENGTAGFVLANGSMSSNTSGEGDIRRELIEKDMVDCMIALPGQLFYTTQIPVCLWFITKNKARRPHPENPTKEFRDRRGETLFIDARQLGSMIDRTQKELTKEDISQIANTYHTWRNHVPSSTNQMAKGQSAQSSPPSQGGVAEGRGGYKINNLPHLKTFRKELRNNLTPAEASLWTLLQNKKLDGRKFRRQHSVGNYILDFYCPSEKLAIELDGQGHFNEVQAEYDRERDLFINAFGIKVLRFENKEVFENTESVLNAIKEEFGWYKNHPALQEPGEDLEKNHPALQAAQEDLEKNHPALQAPLLWKEGNYRYEDIPGYCKSSILSEIQANDYVLTPGRYVGVAEEEDDGVHFEDKMTELTAVLKEQMAQAEHLDQAILENLKALGYE